jgi:hypothetical protein
MKLPGNVEHDVLLRLLAHDLQVGCSAASASLQSIPFVNETYSRSTTKCRRVRHFFRSNLALLPLLPHS